MKCCHSVSPGRLPHLLRRACLLALVGVPLIVHPLAHGEDKKPGTDVLIFTNGDQLTGTLKSESDGSVIFHGDMSGDVKVEWKKIKSLQTKEQVAVIPKGAKLKRGAANPQVAVGTLSVEDDQVSVSRVGGEVRHVPSADAAYLVNGDDYQKIISHEPGFFHAWTGGVTLGATLVQSTQTSQTLIGSAALVRAIPTVDWLAPKNKTTFDANATYGLVTQPFIAGVQDASSAKTNILHGDLERDQYVTPRLYYLFDASADHNIGSGLRLQQVYGAGAGYSVIQGTKRTLDVKGDIHYERQEFYPAESLVSGETLNLIGASIGEQFMQKFPRDIVFNESGLVLPAFNTPAGQPSAYSAQIIAGLLFPVYKNFGFTLGSQDNFVNNPPVGYKKNTFQFTAGVTYTLK